MCVYLKNLASTQVFFFQMSDHLLEIVGELYRCVLKRADVRIVFSNNEAIFEQVRDFF